MATLTRYEFAELCRTTIGVINMNVSRDHIQIDNKMIDTEAPLNRVFIRKRKKLQVKNRLTKTSVKKEIIKLVPVETKHKIDVKKVSSKKKLPKIEDSVPEVKTKQEKEDEDLITRKIRADTEKAETDNELKKMQLEKLIGQLLPVDMVRGILKINIQGVFISFENELQNIASIYCDIMADGDRSKMSEVIEQMRVKLHRVIGDTEKNAKKEVDVLIKQYSVSRSRGERK